MRRFILLACLLFMGAAPPIDINRASAAELEHLPGVGKTRAQAIVVYRAKHPFGRPSDLLQIKGIGKRTYAKLQPSITVGPPPTRSPLDQNTRAR